MRVKKNFSGTFSRKWGRGFFANEQVGEGPATIGNAEAFKKGVVWADSGGSYCCALDARRALDGGASAGKPTGSVGWAVRFPPGSPKENLHPNGQKFFLGPPRLLAISGRSARKACRFARKLRSRPSWVTGEKRGQMGGILMWR
ncbi:MAG: hypothetical protein CM15mP74_05530 [Halieaceae bacterium]|nr:MAG: hypothetical protein CM15mP74_05530 [Halieaceae bacterium]